MNEKLFNVVLSVGAVKETKEASEWIDSKSRVEEEKFRKLSADLERRRVRRYNQHVEEQEKVKKELVDLQRDRLRFEREKVLRRRNTFSTGRERSQSAQANPHSSDFTKLLKENAFSGGSASIAFDPSSLKYGSRHRRRSKTAPVCFSTGKTVAKERLQWENAKIAVSQEETSGRLRERRNWGAAWLDAKQEQNTKRGDKYKWTSLMLKAEKDKMKVLTGKWIALKESKLASIKNVLNKKHRDVSKPGNDGEGDGSVKKVKFAEKEIGSSQIWSSKDLRQELLPSPEGKLLKYSSRSAGTRRSDANKHERRETNKEEMKIPSIFCKELDANSESLNVNYQMASHNNRCFTIPVISKNHREQHEDEPKEISTNRAPLPVVLGSFLPQLQNN